jgi:acetyltransferase-like isoleucine patch superfamily enzyme
MDKIYIRTAKPKYKFLMDLITLFNKNKYKGLEIGKFCKVNSIHYASNLIIKDYTEISNCNFGALNKINKNAYLFQVTLGDYSYIGGNSSIMNAEIGKFCSIADGVKIGGGIHPSDTFISTHPAFFSVNNQCGTTFSDQSYFAEMGKISIGNDVWIGSNAIVMDNITIGDGAIIGAGAVVNKNIPPYAIAVGIPAKVIKYRFEKEEIDYLLQSKWWDKPSEWLRIHFKKFHSVSGFKELLF